MTLDDLLGSIITEEVIGMSDGLEISSVEMDSRRVQPGSLFVAVRGTVTDGHDYIASAVEHGAVAVVCEQVPQPTPPGAVFVTVGNSAVALGYLASQFFGNPSRQLTLVGVTGTNGKTTIATLLYEMARMCGHRAGLLSTVANRIDETILEADHTTPDQITINRLMRQMVDAGCTFAAMEVSSHAADQHRIAGLHFAGGIFTNLTRDHLDYHKTVQAYLKAKKSFFDNLPSSSWALVNADDPNASVMLQNCRARHLTYSIGRDSDVRGQIIESRIDGTLMAFDGTEVETLFTGRYNASNLTAVYGASLLTHLADKETVLINMSRLVPVAGRFETFRSPSGITAVVDYAHTPDALKNVLSAIEKVKGKGKVISVVGAGGNRDKGKRPLMARQAFALSDRLIITADNPRNEDPAQIADEMLQGLSADERATTLTILDRAQAIRTAVALATPGDVVLVAGKGHETYQEINGMKHHFDDREQVKAALGIA